MNVKVSETKAYYDSITEASLCDCAYCRSYRAQIKSAYAQVAAWLGSLGIDIEKPFETSPLEPDENGMLLYCACQYVVFGNCDSAFYHKIGNVEFRMATSYPRMDIEQECFVMEMFPIQLKYVYEREIYL